MPGGVVAPWAWACARRPLAFAAADAPRFMVCVSRDSVRAEPVDGAAA